MNKVFITLKLSMKVQIILNASLAFSNNPQISKSGKILRLTPREDSPEKEPE
jgi:hypothetical protein